MVRTVISNVILITKSGLVICREAGTLSLRTFNSRRTHHESKKYCQGKNNKENPSPVFAVTGRKMQLQIIAKKCQGLGAR